MKKYILLLTSLVLALGFAHDSVADTEVYIGALSYHVDTDKDLNNINPMFLVSYDDWVAGYFYNSYKNHTGILGKGFWTTRDELSIGIIPSVLYGYNSGELVGLCREKVCLSALPVFKYTIGNWSPTLIYGGTFASVAVSYKF